MKILCIEVYCIPTCTNKLNGRYSVLRTCHILVQQIKIDCLTMVTPFNCTHAEGVGLCESRTCL